MEIILEERDTAQGLTVEAALSEETQRSPRENEDEPEGILGRADLQDFHSCCH